MEDSVFTKIIKGEIPSHKVYEDSKTIAFMDIHPAQPGMLLVVPKTQVENFYDLDDEDYAALWNTVKKVSEKLARVFPDKKRIGLQVEGLDVPHVHVKILPINSGSEFHAKPDPDGAVDHDALAALAAKLSMPPPAV